MTRPELTVERVELLRLAMPLRLPFRTSFGTQTHRDVVLARVQCDGVEGWGELVAGEGPWYSEETVGSALVVLREHLIPHVIGASFSHPTQLAGYLARIRGNPMARATIETACWDAWAAARGESLAHVLGGVRERVVTGVSVGIQDSVPELLDLIEGYLDQGYARIKVKIEPGWDIQPLTAIRERFGEVSLMADANSAYRLKDASWLQQLDGLHLTMVEQPLAHDDVAEHALLARQMKTPICLDESLRSAALTRHALDIGACQVVNVKVGRLGGHSESRAVHRLCAERGVPLWCGGMLETGVGRLHNLAIASLPGFTLPGDTSASERYWERDIIDPPVTLEADGTVAVPTAGGIATRLDRERLDALAVGRESF